MWFFQIRIVIVQPLVHIEATTLIELIAHLVFHVHVQIDALYVFLLSDIGFQIFHHLAANLILSVRLQNHKGKDVGGRDTLIILNPDGVASNHYVVVVDCLGMGCVLREQFEVEACTVLDWQAVVIQFPYLVDVSSVDIAKSYSQFLHHHNPLYKSGRKQLCNKLILRYLFVSIVVEFVHDVVHFFIVT